MSRCSLHANLCYFMKGCVIVLIETMAQKLRKLNPEGRFIVLSWDALAIKQVDPETMTCPENFYYDPELKIIRRPGTLLGRFTVSESENL